MSNDEQAEGDENLQDVDDLTNEEKLALNILSHECSSVMEAKESNKDITDKRDVQNYE